MSTVLYAVLVLGLLGALLGLILAVASKFFVSQKDSRFEEICRSLPGRDCGGCGFPGCESCAEAILSGKAPVNACPVCSGTQTTHIAAIMDVEVTPAERRVAFVRCAGGNRANKKYEYVGLQDCAAAMEIAGNGPLDCAYGCLGFGSCVKVCAFDALHINAYGVAEVDRAKCTDCRRCQTVCPRGLVVDVPFVTDFMVRCASREVGEVARGTCALSCISCRLCEKNCPMGAVSVKENVAVIDYSKCTSCGICAAKCPRKVIVNIHDDGKVAPVIKQ